MNYESTCIFGQKYNKACLATNSTPSPHLEIRNVLLKHVIEWKHSKIIISEGIAPVIEDYTLLTSFSLLEYRVGNLNEKSRSRTLKP
jgi:hypothetical protein